MNSKQIIGHIMAATGKNISELARERGNTKQAWYDVIKGRTKSPIFREYLSGLTGKSIAEMWPENTETKEAA